MRREDCMHCWYLVEGDEGEWVCDEEEMNVEEVERCPEGCVNTEISLHFSLN